MDEIKNATKNCGFSFTIGLVIGGAKEGLSGARMAPKGVIKRIWGAFGRIKLRALPIAGLCSAVGFTYSICNSAMVVVRGKEDIINTYTSIMATSGLLSLRCGLQLSAFTGVASCATFGIMHACAITFGRIAAKRDETIIFNEYN